MRFQNGRCSYTFEKYLKHMKAIPIYLYALVFFAETSDAQLSQSDVHDMAMGNATVACLPPNSIFGAEARLKLLLT